MASMIHYNLGAGISLRKTLNSKFSAVQPNNIANARHLSNLVVTSNVHSPIPKFTFPQQSLTTKRQLNVAAKNKEDQWKLRCGDCAPGSTSDSVDDIDILIHKFFYAINSRTDEQLLEDVLSSDCVFKDFIFQTAFDGEQSILQFLRKVMMAMGPNIRFKIERPLRKNELQAATAFLHLEWNNQVIPFTRFCTDFECEEFDEKHLIRKITLVKEQGEVVDIDIMLKLLKAASTIFDMFPDQTRELLSKLNE
uniref:SnoaL-like domain-containing protein n=1 Tax=Populus davidiana TaxID=266767 RepID=A0A6M2EV56_9ROSI